MKVFEKHILHLPQTESTNDFLKDFVQEGLVQSPFCVRADMQTQGKGQRGKFWESQDGENILASFLVDYGLKNTALPRLNLAASLAIIDTLNQFGISEGLVKWPNDIYVKDKKIAGILIENTLEKDRVKHSIIGIGLNVNQRNLTHLNATSMHLHTGGQCSVDEVLEFLYQSVYRRLDFGPKHLLEQVNERLFKKGQKVQFSQPQGKGVFEVLEITPQGGLLVKGEKGTFELEHHQSQWII